MSVPPEVKQQEAEIIAELRKIGIQAYFRINKIDPKTKAWEHSITFQNVHTTDEYAKVFDIIRKHHEKYTKHAY